MAHSSIKNIAEVLQNSAITRVIERANQLAEMQRTLSQKLPQHYRGLYRVANLVDNQLVIEVQNATIRHGLQLQQTQLLTLIQTVYPNVQTLMFKVNPSFHS